jgi:hypothetical protein
VTPPAALLCAACAAKCFRSTQGYRATLGLCRPQKKRARCTAPAPKSKIPSGYWPVKCRLRRVEPGLTPVQL